MSDAFIGEIKIVGFNFAPRGWAFCDGQLLSIVEHQALFSLLGTAYGGDGRTTFGLPDLRGRVPLHIGQGPGLPHYQQGQKGGSTTIREAPAHTHAATLHGEATDATSRTPDGNMLAGPAGGNEIYAAPAGSPGQAFSSNTITVDQSGPSEVSVQNPYLGCSYVIALGGMFPSRS